MKSRRRVGIGLLFAGAVACCGVPNLLIAAEPEATERVTLPIDHAQMFLAPYVWKMSGLGTEARAEAAMPGAYLKAVVEGTTTLGLIVDGTANRDYVYVGWLLQRQVTKQLAIGAEIFHQTATVAFGSTAWKSICAPPT